MLESLAAQQGVNEVLLEAGPVLSGSFLRAGLVDELVIFVGAKLLGHKGLPLLNLPQIDSLQQSLPLEFVEMTRIGEDCRIIAKPGKP